jgi:hypothetical protein
LSTIPTRPIFGRIIPLQEVPGLFILKKAIMIETLNEQEIESVLKERIMGHLGCHADGKTYVIPISYAYADGDIYIHTTEGTKITALRKNPRVCFQVDDRNNMGNWKSVIVWGEYQEITKEEERNAALKALIARHLPILSSDTTHLGGTWPFIPENLNSIGGIVFRILIEEKSGKCEKNHFSPAFAV